MKNEMLLSSVNNPLKWIAEKSRVGDHARQVADVSDRWFLAVTGTIIHAGDWARREAWIAADSAVAAFATTVDLAKKLSSAEHAAVEKTTTAGQSAAANQARWSRADLGVDHEDSPSLGASTGRPDLDLVAAV